MTPDKITAHEKSYLRAVIEKSKAEKKLAIAVEALKFYAKSSIYLFEGNFIKGDGKNIRKDRGRVALTALKQIEELRLKEK